MFGRPDIDGAEQFSLNQRRSRDTESESRMRHNVPRAQSRTWALLWVAALLSLAAMTIASSPASAHAYLESSIPAENAQLSAIPSQVSLTFGDNVEAEFTKVTLSVGADAPATLATSIEDGTVTIPIPGSVEWQPAGSTAPWTITYRTVADDGHPVEGTVSFTVTATAPATAIPSPKALTPETSAPNTTNTGPQSASAETVQPFDWTAVALLSAGSVVLVATLWLLARQARRVDR